MIHEIDEALALLIRREALGDGDVEVLFDAPTKDWASRRNAPTIDVYLYDIREDLKRRTQGTIELRNDQGLVIERKPPPRFYKLSYLLTAWTQRPEDEHRLLSNLLASFMTFEALPPDVLTGSTGSLGLPVPVTIALPPPEDRSLSDIWSALGGELKPSLDLVVVSPIETGRAGEVGPPVLETARLRLSSPEGTEETKGRKGAKKAAPKRRTAVAEETVKVGSEDAPGRVFHMRGTVDR